MSSVYSRSNTARRSISNLQVTSTTLSHTVNSLDDTKAAVVIEIGRKLTKQVALLLIFTFFFRCGYSGEFLPRIICRTEYYDENCTLRRDFLDGYENGKKPNLNSLLRFFKYLFYKSVQLQLALFINFQSSVGGASRPKNYYCRKHSLPDGIS